MTTVPIGLLTRNRVAYLDVTLKSLSATDLPQGVSVTVYDDASDDPATREYISSTGTFLTCQSVPRPQWPKNSAWRKLGLSLVDQCSPPTRCVADLVRVVSFAESAGVVQASAWAVRDMLQRFPDAPGAILLQDDVLFNVDWYTRLVGTALDPTKFSRPLGVLAGIKINKAYSRPLPPVSPSGITAQCLYVSRRAYDKVSLFHDPQTKRTRFDDMLKQRVDRAGLWAGVILPFVCQHFGVQSLVRPGRGWNRGPSGRVGYCSHPPYVVVPAVKDFLRSS